MSKRRYNSPIISIQDNILVDDEGREEVEQIAKVASEWMEITDRPFGAQMICTSAVVAEVVLLALTLFGLHYVQIVLNIVYILALGLVAAFAIGFFILFSAYKMYKNEISPDDDVHIDGGVMSGYVDEENSRRQLAGYYFGAVGAILNTVIWIALFTTRV